MEKCKSLHHSLNDKNIKEENKIINEIKEKPKIFYKFAKRRSKTNESIGPLLNQNGSITSDQSEMCSILNTQYPSVLSKPLTEQEYNEYDSHRMNNLNIQSTLDSVIITNEKLRKAFARMKPFASPGPDGIPAKCFKSEAIL